MYYALGIVVIMGCALGAIVLSLRMQHAHEAKMHEFALLGAAYAESTALMERLSRLLEEMPRHEIPYQAIARELVLANIAACERVVTIAGHEEPADTVTLQFLYGLIGVHPPDRRVVH